MDMSSLQLSHQAPPHLGVDNAAHTKRRDDSTYSRRGTHGPVLPHEVPPFPHAGHGRAIIQVQPEEVQRRGEELNGGGGEELGGREAGDVAAHIGREPLIEIRREEGRDVEAGKDGHAVADGEEGEAGHGHGFGGDARGAEELDEDLVLVDAGGDVGGGAGGELGGAGRDAVGGLVGERGRGGVDGVGRQVRAAVEEEDERRGLGEEDVVGAEEERAEGCEEGLFEGGATGGVFHDCSVDID